MWRSVTLTARHLSWWAAPRIEVAAERPITINMNVRIEHEKYAIKVDKMLRRTPEITQRSILRP